MLYCHLHMLKGHNMQFDWPGTREVNCSPLNFCRFTYNALETANYVSMPKPTPSDLHRRLGHISIRACRELVRRGKFKDYRVGLHAGPQVCESCINGKLTRRPILRDRAGARATKFGDLIQRDVWEPAKTTSLGDQHSFLVLVDDCTRSTSIYFIRRKRVWPTSSKKFAIYLLCSTAHACVLSFRPRWGVLW